MKLTPRDVAREAAESGFRADVLEKVFHLIALLDALNAHPFLKQRVVLKGGAALNLFLFETPRLSVDLDLNYLGPVDRDAMLAERPKVEQALQGVFVREELGVKRAPGEHAGGKWQLRYTSSAGEAGNVELDINFMLRTPLWPPVRCGCHPVGSFRAASVNVLDVHELAAGKLAALLARGAGRDLFDAHRLLTRTEFDRAKLRLAFVVYGGINRKDWRTVSLDDVQGDPGEMLRALVPMLHADLAPARGEIVPWTHRLVAECRDLLSVVLPLTPDEAEFLRRLNDDGEIAADLLTGDVGMQEIIRNHPGLLWKGGTVRIRVKTFMGGCWPRGELSQRLASSSFCPSLRREPSGPTCR